MATRFKYNQKVWMMYANRPVCVPVSEIRINIKVEYYFWHQDFPAKDKSICYQNLFRVDEDKLYETKESLLNAL